MFGSVAVALFGAALLAPGATPDLFDGLCDRPVLDGRQFVLSRDIGAMTAGDVDGDGRNEVIFGVSSTYPGFSMGVVVAFMDPRGKTPVEVFSPASVSPTWMFASDLDRDGTLDLVVGREKGGVAALIGVGDGTFVSQEVAEAYGYTEVCVVDVDGNGYPDLCGILPYDAAVYVHCNDGTGGFGPRTSNPLPWCPDSIRSADMDGDGDADLVVANETIRKSALVVNDGLGVFGSVEQLDALVTELADMDGDERPDLIAVDVSTGTVRVLRNSGLGSFDVLSSVEVSPFPDGILVSDVDADGRADVVMLQEYAGQVRVFRNTGGGALELLDDSPTSRRLRCAAMCDIDGRNGPDFIGSGYESRWGVLYNDGEGRVRPHVLAPLSGVGCDSIISVDVNSDGMVDFVCAGQQWDRVVCLVNLGDGAFEPRAVVAVSDLPMALGALDVTGEGHVDIVVSTRNTIDVLAGDGLGHFVRSAVVPLSSSSSISRGSTLSVGDIDADGDDDIVVGNSGLAKVQVFLNDGVGALAEPGVSMSIGGSPRGTTLADVDQDGDLDIVIVKSYAPNLLVMKNQGDGTFTNPVPATASPKMIPYGVAMGDIDGNGKVDVVVDAFEGVFVFPNDGSGAFPESYRREVGDWHEGFALGDVDGDGRVDIVTIHGQANEIEVMRNLGSQGWCEWSGYYAGRYPTAAAVADVDGDGRDEVNVCSLYELGLATLKASALARLRLCPADVDGDAYVTTGDFNILAGHFGEAVPAGTLGDLTGDGVVNSADFNVLANDFGSSCP